MSEQHDPFLHALERYADAVRAKDVAAFAAIYADDLHVFDLWGRWSLQGLDAWRAMAADWFASLGDEQVVVGVTQARSLVSGDLAVGHAILRFTALSATGEELRSLDNRISMALQQRDGVWKVVHEHTSAPVDHESLKAILRRQD